MLKPHRKIKWSLTWFSLVAALLFTLFFVIITENHGLEQSALAQPPAIALSTKYNLSTKYKTGKALDKELELGVGLFRTNVEARNLIQALATPHQVAVILDRRVNPNQKVSIQLQSVTLHKGWEAIAEKLDIKLKRVENTLYLGPPQSANQIRTLIFLRKEEFKKLRSPTKRMRKNVAEKVFFKWDDLQSPRQLVGTIAYSSTLQVKNLHAIPHDLWKQGALPNMDAIEALSLVLVQYDLTFEWLKGGSEIKIVPITDTQKIVRRIPTGKQNQSKAIAMIQAEFPKAFSTAFSKVIIKKSGTKRLEFQGTIEQLEQIQALLSGKKLSPHIAPRKYVALARQRFDMTVKQKPVSQLLKSLVRSGLSIEYDEKKLREQKVSLDQLVSFTIKNATIEKLLEEICDPVKLQFQIKGEQIQIFQK